MEMQAGGGVFGLGNPGGRGGHSDPGNPDGRGDQKTLPSVGGGGGGFFSGITYFVAQHETKFTNSPLPTCTHPMINFKTLYRQLTEFIITIVMKYFLIF